MHDLRALRRAVVLAAIVLALIPGPATFTQPEGDALLGRWETTHTDNGWAHVEVVRQGSGYDGRIVWVSEDRYPAGDPMAGEIKVDRENPDPALRTHKIVGLTIVRGLAWDGEGRWEGGTIYDPESGNTYKSWAELEPGGDRLKLRGYVGFSLLGRTTYWTRVR